MRDRPLCSICLIVFVGFCICIRAGGARFVEELRPSPLEQKVQRGEMIQFTGQVYQKEIKENDQVLYLKDVQVTYQKQSLNESRIIIHDETKQQLHIGNRITGSGEVSFYETSRNPGNFDPKLYYQRQKIHAYVWAQSMEITGEQEDRIQNGLYRLRKNWSQMLREVMGEKDGATFAAILLGEKSSMDKELKELYQVNGIAHILAISGLHLSFIGVGMYRLLRRVTGSYPAGGVCGIVFLLCYILMIGMTVSAMRALIMFLFRVGADMTGRHYDSPTALSAAAVMVLLWRPLSIYDGGFWLSFGAVLAIIIILPIFKSLPFQSLMASFSIQLLLIPISLYYFYEIPLYGVLLNLLVIPLLTVLLAAGLAGSFVSLLFLPAGSLVLGGCRWIFRLYEWSAKITLTLPGARIVTGQPKLWKVVLYYGFLAAAWMIWRKKSKVPKSIAVFLLGAGLCALTVRPNISKSVQVTFLDVGQGDAVFLQGTDGTTCLVDGGSSDVSKVGEYRIEPYLLWRGVNRLDHIFVTHGDTDHINGIEELIKRQKVGVKIGRLVLPDRKVWDEKLRALAVLAQEEGIPVAEMKAADLLRSGELTLTCIQPEEDGTTPPGNASSMVLAVKYREFDLLLTGDVEEEGEECLIKNLEEQYPDTTWEVLKTAHHGSRNSTTEEFLESVSPAYAIISAGVENRYGHPHPETLERLKRAKSKVYSTQDNGAVTITVEDEKMTAEGHL